MTKFIRFGIAFLLVFFLADLMPQVVNGVLILIVVGVVLGHYSSFEGLANILTSIGGS